MLATILLAPEPLHLRAIADRAEVPYSVAQREVDRLEKARLVTSTRFHTARVVRPNQDHPLYPELRALFLKAYGPVTVLSNLLQTEVGVVDAYLFGSWAARYEGIWGEPPADIDVLVVGTMPIARAEELEAEAEDRLGQPVQLTVVSPDDWVGGRSSFVRTVKSRPLAQLHQVGHDDG